MPGCGARPSTWRSSPAPSAAPHRPWRPPPLPRCELEPTDAEIAARLRAILSSDEFQPYVSERILVWLGDAVRWLKRWLDALSPAMRVLVTLVCVVVLVAIAVYLLRIYRDAAAPHRLPSDNRVGPEQTLPSPEGLLARARSLADEGSLRDAARTLQQAMLLQTCREQSLPWRSSLSDWEWMRILRPSENIVDFTQATQRMAFGPRPSRAEFDECAARVEASLERRDHEGSSTS